MNKRVVFQVIVVICLALLIDFYTKSVSPAYSQTTSGICDSVTEIPQAECAVLVDFYSATSGPDWINNTGWLTTATPCSWYGLSCVDGHIQSINLGSNNLSGTLPSSWDAFTQLGALNLPNNQLTGPLPTSISLVADNYYVSMDLSNNLFTGTIPGEYADVHPYFVLNLSNNLLTGSIPPEFGHTTFESLSLAHNQITGPVPVGMNAYGLYLNHTFLSGPLPDGVYGFFDTDVNDTLLSGALPQSLTNIQISSFNFQNTGLCAPSNQAFQDWLATLYSVQTSGLNCSDVADLRQNGPVTLSGNIYEGGKVYLNIPVENYGSKASPPLHIYTEGFTPLNSLWRADNAQPTARIIQPGETVTFRVEHDLWNGHIGTWSTFGVFIWNDASNSYYGSLESNGFDQSIEFYVADITISHIEINQAIQNEENNVILIQDKPTLVRVYVDCGLGCQNVEVTGNLRGYGSNGELLNSPLEPLNEQIMATHQNWVDQRGNYYKSLNFILPKEWTQGALTLEAEVAGTVTNITRAFQPGPSVRIAWTLIPYHENSTNVNFYADINVAASGDQFLKQIFPIAENDLVYFFQPGLPDFIDQKITTDNASQYNKVVRNFWNRIEQSESWVGGSAPDRIYGWYPSQARTDGGICGNADAIFAGEEGKVAVGSDQCNKYLGVTLIEVAPDEVFAHEMGHILDENGLKHTLNVVDENCFAIPDNPNNDYPEYSPRGSIGQYGIEFNSSLVIHSPEDTYDFMSYCKNLWVSPHNYAKLFFWAPVPKPARPLSPTAPERRLLVSGTVYTPTMTVDFDPFYAITSSVPLTTTNQGDYCFQLQAETNDVLSEHCFDLNFASLENPESMNQDVFSFVIPYPEGSTLVQLTHLSSPIANLPISANQPAVTLVSPNGGENWSANGTYTVSWTAHDIDNDPLYYVIEYSADAGTTWWPVASNLTATSYQLDVSQLPGSSEVLLRISASDGVNTGYDSSNATFSVARKLPRLGILSPVDGTTIVPGSPILLQSYAYDLEDGNLDNTSMEWSSSQDGLLGNGRQLLVSLTPGEHIITLTVTDSDNNVAKTTATIFVGQRIFLPTVLRK